jgi:pyridoxamine 5'-phosphate oxidase
MNLADIRQNYTQGELHRADLAVDPFVQFETWMAQASAAGVIEPTAMSLATCGASGLPRVRTVLLKGVDERGFVFFTNRESRKGDDLAANPRAALLFPWLALERQVLVAGPAELVADEDTRTYFSSRPFGSRLAAWASHQSQPIASRAALEADLEASRARFTADEQAGVIPVPPFWGGYRVRPQTIEFWQGRSNRLHDRFEYTRQPDGSWKLERLAP